MGARTRNSEFDRLENKTLDARFRTEICQGLNCSPFEAEAVLQAGHPWMDQMRERRGELMTKIASPKHRADPGFQRALGQTLAELKTSYQDAYIASHTQARLGATDDQRKARLGQDHRLHQLQQLSTVEMMPAQQLRDFQNALFRLKTCFSLTKQDLDADPSSCRV